MKRYDQYCPIAHSLGLIGERWTLLVVRELLYGPKRYTDLAAELPGIGTNILAARLKELESAGIVEKKKLPPPFASTVYELTPAGQDLRPVLHELARFGARLMGPPAPDALEPGWLDARARPRSLTALPGQHGSRSGSGDEEASLVDCTATPGIAEDYDVLVETDATGFYYLVVDRKLEGVRVEGDVAALEQLLDGFAPTARFPPEHVPGEPHVVLGRAGVADREPQRRSGRSASCAR